VDYRLLLAVISVVVAGAGAYLISERTSANPTFSTEVR
jgi:hypothetical protein